MDNINKNIYNQNSLNTFSEDPSIEPSNAEFQNEGVDLEGIESRNETISSFNGEIIDKQPPIDGNSGGIEFSSLECAQQPEGAIPQEDLTISHHQLENSQNELLLTKDIPPNCPTECDQPPEIDPPVEKIINTEKSTFIIDLEANHPGPHSPPLQSKSKIIRFLTSKPSLVSFFTTFFFLLILAIPVTVGVRNRMQKLKMQMLKDQEFNKLKNINLTEKLTQLENKLEEREKNTI
jgi:hypothetical protein